LKALSEAEALKKPSVSASAAAAAALRMTIWAQVRHLFADVLDEKTEILKQQEQQMLKHLAKYSQHYNANLYEQ
jgi:hypothetical protein